MTDQNKNPKPFTPEEEEDFWLELGPPSAYVGLDAYQTARREGDASPDGKRLGFTGAEPKNTAVLPDTDTARAAFPPMAGYPDQNKGRRSQNLCFAAASSVFYLWENQPLFQRW